MRDVTKLDSGQWVTTALFALAAGARIFEPGLHSLDDCFYARKALEMQRAGSWLTVLWGGHPTWQNPPLQLDLIAASFRVFGLHDAAARLPQLVMAVALLPLTGLVAWRLKLTTTARALAVALLATTPVLLGDATRVMLDVPAAFWCAAVIASALWMRSPGLGRRAPAQRLLAAVCFAVSVGAALLTKSVLGLLPLGVLAVAWLLRAPHRRIGVLDVVAAVAGLALGSTWYVHQAVKFGRAALDAHFVGEIALRSAAPISWLDRLTGYPLALVRDFEPWVIPALVGVVVVLRARPLRTSSLALLPAWLLAPPLALSLSAVQRPSYLMPLLPAIALAAGYWIDRRWRRAAGWLARRILPGILVIVALIGLVRPNWLGRPRNTGMVAAAPLVQSLVPEGHAIPSHAVSYWRVVNPLLYYTDRMLAAPVELGAALEAAREADGILVVGPAALAPARDAAPDAEELARDRYWVLVRLPRR